MTVSTTTIAVEYTGNGVTTGFSTSFPFLDAEHLVVTVDGALRYLTTHYTVTGGNGSVGTVTLLTAPAWGAAVRISRSVPLTQLTDYQRNDSFPAESHERALDKAAMIAQQIQAGLDRTLRVSTTEDALPVLPSVTGRAQKFLYFNASGDPTVVTGDASQPLTHSVYLVYPTTGQTAIPVPADYTPGSYDLSVYVNGVKQAIGVDYVETAANLITLTVPATLGDVIEFSIGEVFDVALVRTGREEQSFTGLTSPTITLTTASYTPGAHEVDVFFNGALLATADYTETNSTTITLGFTPVASDQIRVIVGRAVDVTNVSRGQVGTALYPQSDAEIAAGITPTDYSYPPGDVRRYGAKGDDVTDDRAAIQNAITVARYADTSAGAEVRLTSGTHLINPVASGDSISNGIVIPYTSANGATGRVKLVGEGRSSILKAGGTGMVVVRLADSHCGIEDLTIDGASLSGVFGLGVLPESVTQTATGVHQNYNRVRGLYVKNCTEALAMQAGPKVAGYDSGCWYNDIELFVYACTRGIWMRNPPNAASGVNRNTITGRVGQECNTGLQIDSGVTNTIRVHFEGIDDYTSPNTTPTAVKIANSDAFGADNNDNSFEGCHLEGNTRDLDNANPYTRIIGGSWTATKFGGGGVDPLIMIGGYPSIMPTIIPGLKYGEGVAGYPSGYIGTTKEIADTGYAWADYALTTSNMTNVTSVLSQYSKYTKRGNVVTWQAVCQFQATVAATVITITPPLAAAQAMYCSVAAVNGWHPMTVVGAGGTHVIVVGGFNNAAPGKFHVSVPAGNWVTGAASNLLWISVEYHT